MRQQLPTVVSGKKVASLIAIAAAVAATVQAGAAPLYWDTAASDGLQAGAGTWDASGGTNWANSNSPGTAAPGAWTQGSDANFIVNGASAIILKGDVQAASIVVKTWATPTIADNSGDGSDSLTLGAAGIDHTGSGALTFNTNVTLGANQTWKITNNNGIVVNGAVGQSAAGTSLAKTGSGLVILAGDNTYTGTTTVNTSNVGDGEGTLRVGNGGATGSLSSSSIVVNRGRLEFNSSGDHTYAGNITAAAVGASGVDKYGSGTLTLTGTNTFDGGSSIHSKGGLNVNGGRVILTGSTSASYGIWVGSVTNYIGSLLIQPGANVSASVLHVGGTNGAGGVVQTGGTSTLTTQLLVGKGGYGFYDLQAGTINAGATNSINVGTGANARGVLYQSAGSINTTQNLILAPAGEAGIAFLTGGTYGVVDVNLAVQSLGVGGKRAELTLAGTAQMTFTGSLYVGNNANANAVLNLGGNAVAQTGGTNGFKTSTALGGVRQVNFDGGTLRYTGTGTFSTLAEASSNYEFYVRQGGAKIDIPSSTARSAINQPLLTPVGDGVVNTVGTTIPIIAGGSGYVGAPVVTIFGAPGATAVANMEDDATGKGTFKVKSITITNPGNNAVAPTFTFEAVPGATAATPVALTTAANVSGGLVKTGAGTLDLAGVNTYTGETSIQNGTLRLTAAGSLDQSPVNVAAGATFDASGKTGAVLQRLGGAGTVKAKDGVVADRLQVTQRLTPGDGGVGTLTFSSGDLRVGNGVTYDYEIGGTTASPVSDLIDLTQSLSGGDLSFDGNWTLKLLDVGTVDPTGKQFVLFDYTSGSVPSWTSVTVDTTATNWAGGTVSVDTTNRRIVLSDLSVVPEPTGMALLALAALPMVRRRRR